jgi:two-component SAPR family response regulator
MNKALNTLLLFICSSAILCGQEAGYGLQFKSYEVEKEKRTSLNLTPDAPFSFPHGFRMSFEAKFNVDRVHPFGSVFRIISEERRHIDLILSEIDNTGRTMVSFISPSNDLLFSQPFDSSEIDYGKYIRFEITIDIKNNRIDAAVGNNTFSKQSSLLTYFNKASIVFGKSNYPRFQTTDVPAFSLRNLEITTIQGTPLYAWPLSKHAENGVYDTIKNHFALSENAGWILDSHAIWQKKTTIKTRINPQFCYNPDKNEIAVFDRDLFYRYAIRTNTLEENKTTNPLVFNSSNSNNLIYNPLTKTYNAYLLELDKGTEVLTYDTLSQNWNKPYATGLPPDYWHHNRLFSTIDNRLYMFFGYGHHRYKNEINRYDYETKSWEKLSLKGDRIQPRYLSGFGMLDEQYAIVFGGYGSETGNQNISPQSYYNLFKINLRTLEAGKLWEMGNPPKDFAVANTLVTGETGGKWFYALAFPTQQFYTSLSLLQFSMEKPEYKVVADSIPFHFEDVRSGADLFFDKSSQQLVAVIANAQPDESCEISVYTLAMPPLTPDALYQDYEGDSHATALRWMALAALLFVLPALCALIIVQRRKRRRPSKPAKEEVTVAGSERPGHTTPYQHPGKQAIYLFGGFQVFDKNGEDITKDFTPMLRQLFILLLLNTVKNGKGISSVKLKDMLWYDKSDESAKNNRGVFMNKLRQLFEHIGRLQIKNRDIYWSIELGDDIYCDYTGVLALMNRISSGAEPVGKDNIKTLLAIVSKGELLPNIQTEWIDPFKSDFSNQLIDLLLEAYKQPFIHQSPQICINLADAIFMHDSLNEDALSIKCHNLVQMGKYGLARKVYTFFVKEYKTLFNSDFAHSFEKVINNK